MRSPINVFKHALLPGIWVSLVIFSCTSRALLPHGEPRDESQFSILQVIGSGFDHNIPRGPVSSIFSGQSLSTFWSQSIWISSIDNKPASEFLQGKRNSKKYYLLPGKHEIAVMFEGRGERSWIEPLMLYDVSANWVRTVEEYKGSLTAPLIFNIETEASKVYTIIESQGEGTCRIRIENNGVVLNEKVGLLGYSSSVKSMRVGRLF